MEKLLKLLNEYFDKDWIFKAIWHNDRLEIFDLEVKDDFVRDETVISKKFWFIEWLVQNNKINKRKIDTRLVRYVENHYDEEWYWVESSYEDYSDTNTLLMLLSISSTPIEDLISYLR